MAAGDVIVVRENAYGKKGNYFDGTDDYVLHDDHAVARVAANDTTGTYSTWFYLTDLLYGVGYTILSAGDNDNTDQGLTLSVSGTYESLQAVVKVGGADQWHIRTANDTILAKTWYHCTVVHNGEIATLFINGKKPAQSKITTIDLTPWYDALTNVDKFAIGVKESNNTHTADFKGAIGQVKYWNRALTDDEVLADYNGEALSDDGTYLQLNVTMEDNGTTDSGLGADNGTLTGHAHYGGEISAWSQKIENNATGTSGETLNTVIDGDKYVSVIKKVD